MLDQLLSRAHNLSRRRRAGARVRTILTNDGRVWPVYHTVPPPYQVDLGVPVVLFHGFGNDGGTWLRFMPTLGGARELVAPDLPGFGGHPLGETENPTPRWYRSVVAELLRELTVRWGQPPIVVGKSMGGLIAGLLAGELPHLVRTLVLIDPAGIETPIPSPFWQQYREGRNLLLPTTSEEWDQMVDTLYHRRPRIPGFMRREALRQINTNYADYKRIFEGLLSEGYNPLGSRLSRIQCPVSVVWGAQDHVMDPSGVEVITAALPKASITVLNNCGHSPTRERPEELTRVLLDVLSRWG
ncbi:MAG: alpha/beta fold hydrolase [Alkalispirochaeta sp.]